MLRLRSAVRSRGAMGGQTLSVRMAATTRVARPISQSGGVRSAPVAMGRASYIPPPSTAHALIKSRLLLGAGEWKAPISGRGSLRSANC